VLTLAMDTAREFMETLANTQRADPPKDASDEGRHCPSSTHEKLAASSVLPEPLYRATCG
jgi:hypothetical protein